MREYCQVCDAPMRLLTTDSDSPVLLWECCRCQPGNLLDGSRLLTPNWGVLLPSWRITDLDEYQHCPDDDPGPGPA